jgi:hypothetical protein
MALYNRLTDINSNITNLTNKSTAIYDKLNNIDGNIDSTHSNLETNIPILVTNTNNIQSTLNKIEANTGIVRIGSFGNVANNITIVLDSFQTSSFTLTAENFTSKSFISYQDENILLETSISIWTSINNNNVYITSIFPNILNGNSTIRVASTFINLAPFTNIYLKNDSETDDITAVYCTILSA